MYENNHATMMTRASCQFGLKCIDEQITSGLLKRLETRKATGMDGISSKLLKLTAPSVAGSLTQLFTYSLKTGEIPTKSKSATCVREAERRVSTTTCS